MTEDTRSTALVSIGELARKTGLSVRTIRFYCDEGLLESQRSTGGHRIFEETDATERLLLVRQLRALGVGLNAITDLLRGQRSLTDVVAAESSHLDSEIRSMAWRRAALRAVECVTPSQHGERLALLAAVQDGAVVHESLSRFWQRVLAPLPQSARAPWVCWNVPQPPADPSVEEVLAYAELVALAAAPGMTRVVRQQYWRARPESLRDPHALYIEVGEVMVDVVARVGQRVGPYAGDELDRFVAAHARARGQKDSSAFRQQLMRDASDSDQRIHRYWKLTNQLLGTRITIGEAHDWLYKALAASAGQVEADESRFNGPDKSH